MAEYSFKILEFKAHHHHPLSLAAAADIAESALVAARDHEVINEESEDRS